MFRRFLCWLGAHRFDLIARVDGLQLAWKCKDCEYGMTTDVWTNTTKWVGPYSDLQLMHPILSGSGRKGTTKSKG